jgi:2,4-dichlorophenol 6-monooxygenase
MCNAPQHVLEPILLDQARFFGADIRFDHEVTGIEQTPEGVIARIRNSSGLPRPSLCV